MKIPFWKRSCFAPCHVFPEFFSFLSYFLSPVFFLFLRFLKRQINAVLISKVIKMYYESPALLNRTVYEIALNLAGTEKYKRPKEGERMSEDHKGRNFITMHCQQEEDCDISYWIFLLVCVCVDIHAYACIYLCENQFKFQTLNVSTWKLFLEFSLFVTFRQNFKSLRVELVGWGHLLCGLSLWEGAGESILSIRVLTQIQIQMCV